MQSKVEICGVNTAKLPVLKNAETMHLIQKAQQGDKTAKDAVIMGNLRLVLSVVQRFSNRGEPMDDLFQVGVDRRGRGYRSQKSSLWSLQIQAG